MREFLCSKKVLRLLASLLFVIVLTSGIACDSPPIGTPWVPIPPPNPSFGPPTQELDSAGVSHLYWKVTSPPSSELDDLWVYVTNIDMGSGVSVRAAHDGSYVTRIEGQEGDWIIFSFGAAYGETRWNMCRPLHEGEATQDCQ